MTVEEVLKQYKSVEIELLLEHVLKKPKEFFFTHKDFKLKKLQLESLKKLVSKRKKAIPIPYLLGHKYFHGLKFKVSKDTLVPRPETEELIDLILEKINPNSNNILDIGTGSGVIAITLATKLNNKANISASDISKKALSIAKANAKTHKSKIKFYYSNLLKNVKGKFNLIIANLPYVPAKDYKKLYQNLKYEPKIALTDNSNNGKIYKELLSKITPHLEPDSQIFLEIDPSQDKYISKYSKKYLPKAEVTFYKDLKNHTRFVQIKNSQ